VDENRPASGITGFLHGQLPAVRGLDDVFGDVSDGHFHTVTRRVR
jgi:hypothetical protein